MEKPIEITELEKNYNISILLNDNKNGVMQPSKENSYQLNEKMELVGLNLSFNKISDITFLSRFTNLTYLNIEQNEIEDISSLSHLTQLTYLNCNNNNISDISVLADLKKINQLNLWNNEILDISALSNLTQLYHLSLWNNKISDISVVSNLRELRHLDLDRNRISDITVLKNLTKLTTLYLNNNKIKDISVLQNLVSLTNLFLDNNNFSNISILEYLPKLVVLNLSSTKLQDYSLINSLTSLTDLYLNDNEISNISFLKNLKFLRNLNLSHNKISDITILKELPQITHLNLENNQISNIYPLKELTKLYRIILKQNLITDIRPLLTLIKNDIPLNVKDSYNNGLNIEQNPLEYPPLQTIKDGNKAIIRFFEKIDKEGTDNIFEAKVTLVGEGSAGKTSLLKRLLNPKEKLPEEKNRTRGISIIDWEFKKQINKKHIAHIWDFGGQDVYYPVHRFFLTENSVFVLLASSRQNTHHFDYWIPTIYQFGGKSPIILGQTCHDGNTTPWNDIGAYIANENFNIIKDQQQNYHEINLLDKNRGLLQIKKSIINQILNLPHYKKSVPKSWIPVRELINDLKEKNCITYFDLKERIKLSNSQSFENKEDIDDCLRFFHSIGIILWYHKETKLKNWIILNPKWSVDAVYKIIDDDKILNQKGIIYSSDFERVWIETIYEDKHDILKDMLEVF